MKQVSRVFLTGGCVLIIIISWIVVLGAKSNDQRQAALMARAARYVQDEIYILAAPLLEEAAGYNTAYTYDAEMLLKNVYLHLINQSGYRLKYISLLEKQMNRNDALPEVFSEAANFQIKNSKYSEAFTVLKKGIEKTKDEELISLYESNRYLYQLRYETYEDVTAIHGSMVGVLKDGLWGIANSDGSAGIPCQYEKISTYSAGRAIVQKNGVIYAVDNSNNRLALLKEEVLDIGNYAGGCLALLTNEGWKRATGDFEIESRVFEEIGTYSHGYAAAKENGKWGLIDRSSTWLIPAGYENIIRDELGRSYAQGAVFVQEAGLVYLFLDGRQVGDTYEDAKPFSAQGYAAVKNNGRWGFIDPSGEVKIGYQFEDALSFGQHLAAIKQGGLWGYINLDGKIVIEPIFLEAKSFGDGNAPVLTERGWQFISLLEYRKGASL
ncbi:MAG: WG repeat-containing protein [Clostridiales bacterium]|nr:WG repeat-containing protein [Clostridiales bacterium]